MRSHIQKKMHPHMPGILPMVGIRLRYKDLYKKECQIKDFGICAATATETGPTFLLPGMDCVH